MFDFPMHSPVQRLFYEVPNGIELYIKRDDLIDPLISGNKWRKLKYTLEKAKTANKTKLISFGGAYSNHLLALANTSAKFGFRCIAFVRGDEVQKENEMLSISRLFGMQIIRVSREEYKDKRALYEKYFGADTEAFFIDEGGISEEGSLGCEEIVYELKEEYSDIFLAAGTGCTTAGIINAINKKQLSTNVHSVIVHQGTEEVNSNISKLTLPTKLQSLVTSHQSPTRYAQHNAELLQFCINFQRNTGILLEPIYTGKAMMKCYEWMNKNEGKPLKVLFIHTGGLLGNLGKLEAYQPYLS